MLMNKWVYATIRVTQNCGFRSSLQWQISSVDGSHYNSSKKESTFNDSSGFWSEFCRDHKASDYSKLKQN